MHPFSKIKTQTKVTQLASGGAQIPWLQSMPLSQLLSREGLFLSILDATQESSLATFPRVGSGDPGHAMPSWLGMRQLGLPRKDPTADQRHWYPGNQPPWLQISRNSWELLRLGSCQ